MTDQTPRAWPELSAALPALSQAGALRDLTGWHVSMADDEAEPGNWAIDPRHWVPILRAAGAKSFHFSRPAAIALLREGEVVVVPDLASKDVYKMALDLQQERPVLTESQLARWLWADDVLEGLGLEPFNPLDGRLFDHLSPTLKHLQTTRSRPIRGLGGYGPSGPTTWW